MQLCLLHLDDALMSQPAFMRTCGEAQHIEALEIGSRLRLWGRHPHLEELRRTLGGHFSSMSNEPLLTFMGSGDFHHVTALLLPFVLEKHPEPVTIVHFDNHPDWVNFDGGMHCGSWVNRALEYPQVSKIITVGVCSHDLRNPDWKGANLSLLSQGLLELYPYSHAPSRVIDDYGTGASHYQRDRRIHWRTIEEMGEEAFIKTLLWQIKTRNVYITIDKDVLDLEDAKTNWDQGKMRLPLLLQLIDEIGKCHKVIGADVTGDYSSPLYTGDSWTRFKKRAEIFIDQPRNAVAPDVAHALNSATNHALLEVLSEVMA